jgi:hypothetical protein
MCSVKPSQNTPPKYRKSLRRNTADYFVKMAQITSNPFTSGKRSLGGESFLCAYKEALSKNRESKEK